MAAVCRWTYPNNEHGHAIIAASDRMLTRGETEYEPSQQKVGTLSRRIIVLVAGNMSIHSEAIQKTRRALTAAPTERVEEVAAIYGAAIKDYRVREAAQIYLSPLGLTPESLARGEAGPLAADLAAQMQGHHLEVEAIVAGHDEAGAHIYHVAHNGFTTCHDDIGFLSIGIGASHADSWIMSWGFANWWLYHDTVLLLYAAKKRAEVAPGVGVFTDMHFVSRDGIAPVTPQVVTKVSELYDKLLKQQRQQVAKISGTLLAYLKSLAPKDQPEKLAIPSNDQT
jgi:hypothetical protein